MNHRRSVEMLFPFLFGGTFIEGKLQVSHAKDGAANFPSFSEGLSLRGGGLARLLLR